MTPPVRSVVGSVNASANSKPPPLNTNNVWPRCPKRPLQRRLPSPTSPHSLAGYQSWPNGSPTCRRLRALFDRLQLDIAYEPAANAIEVST